MVGNRCKTIHLLTGSEEGYEWDIKIDICPTSHSFFSRFFTASRQRRHRQIRRASDRKFAEKTFSRQFRQQYELHHEWERGEVVYFLTHEEHKRREK
jgi:ribosomal protein L31